MPPDGSRRWDVFLSYARTDADRATELVSLLRQHGLSVFVDEADTEGFSSLDAQLRDALATSAILVAFYSTTYPRRPSCQFELMTAFLAGQREGDSRRRIAVVNPEQDVGHIVPTELRDVRAWSWPFPPDQTGRFLHSVETQANALSTPMGAVPTQMPGFVGRYAQLWRLHSQLTRPSLPLTSPGGPRTCLITGLPGAGKTALARQYGSLFGAAFPGGVFWGNVDDLVQSTSGDALTITEVPPGTAGKRVHEWLRGRPANMATLLLSREQQTAPTELIELSGLDDSEALELLTGYRRPADHNDAEQAQLLAAELGGHPQALLLSAAMARTQPYSHVRRAWLTGEFGNVGASVFHLPDGYPADPVPALTQAIDSQPAAVSDVVRVLSILPVRMCGGPLLDAVWTAVNGPSALAGSLDSAADLGLCTRAKNRPFRLHPLIRLLARRLDNDPYRRGQIEETAWWTAADYSGRIDTGAGGSMGVAPLSHAEQQAAFRLQTELASRVTTVPLADGDGFLREALSSLKSVLQIARENLVSLAAGRRGTEVVNAMGRVIDEIRPLLSRWHPLLSEHESLRPGDVGVTSHERNWEHNALLRSELAALQARLRGIEAELEELTGTQLSFGHHASAT